MTEPDQIDEGTDLRTLMERSLHDVHAPTDRLTSVARARGTGLRRRHRAATALGGLAAASVVASLVLTGTGGSRGAGPDVASDPRPTAGGLEVVLDPPAPGSPGFWDMPARLMLQRLQALLPAEVTVTDAPLRVDSTERAPGESGRLVGSLVATLTRPGLDGPGTVEVALRAVPSLEPVDPGGSEGSGGSGGSSATAGEPSVQDRIDCPAVGYDATIQDCTELTDPDGRHVGRTLTYGTGTLTIREVEVVVGGRGLVYVATTNSTDAKWGSSSTASAAGPPLSVSELVTIATDPTWGAWEPPRS